VFYARFPRSMNDRDLRLRPLRIFDAPFMSVRLREEALLKANGSSDPMFLWWWVFWWWIRRTFVLSYCVECDSRRIGFVGLHDLRLGEVVEASMVLFDKDVRGIGYGSRVAALLLESLKKYSIAKRVIARVKADNHISLSFVRKLGFVETTTSDDIVTLSLDLKSLPFLRGKALILTASRCIAEAAAAGRKNGNGRCPCSLGQD
jgi:RimJ/RimL family protein N-acetyltransferase